MRTYLYKFLALFGWQPKLSTETGFVLPSEKEIFKFALKKYTIWMLLVAISTGATEFVAYIIASFYFNYGGQFGTSWLTTRANTIIFWCILTLPIIVSLTVHTYMYRKIKHDDSRLNWLHCLIFLSISLLAAAPSLYLGYTLFFAI